MRQKRPLAWRLLLKGQATLIGSEKENDGASQKDRGGRAGNVETGAEYPRPGDWRHESDRVDECLRGEHLGRAGLGATGQEPGQRRVDARGVDDRRSAARGVPECLALAEGFDGDVSALADTENLGPNDAGGGESHNDDRVQEGEEIVSHPSR